MNILALDLGSNCGFAVKRGGFIESGVVNFTPKARESKGMRFVRFSVWLEEILDAQKPSLVVYEMAHNRGGSATEVLNGMVAFVQAECEKREIDYTSVHSGTLKKFAIGKGNASKELMVSEARKRLKKDLEDDNEADALWIMEWSKKEFRNGKA